MSYGSRGERHAAQVHEPRGPVVVAPAKARAPATGEVRVDVVASGICAADLGTVANRNPMNGFPFTPGHEVAGVVAELGRDVVGWAVGERVVVGWFGGSCGSCAACRSGDVVHCPRRRIPGLSYAGGWASTITVPAAALARVPDGLSATDAAPFGCAGVTTFNALRGSGVHPGERVAVLGIGGLGHLAVQFAAAMGFEVVAVSRGEGKRADAMDLGAHHYIDSAAEDAAQVLRDMGGCRLVLSTSASGTLLADLVGTLVPHGRLIVAGFGDTPLHLPLDHVVMRALTVVGHLTGAPVDTEQAMHCALVSGIRPWVEVRPLSDVREALDVLRTGAARYRLVLTPHDSFSWPEG